MSEITNCKGDMLLKAKQLEMNDLKIRSSDNQEINSYEEDKFIHQASIRMLEEGKYDRNTILKVRESLMNDPNR